MEEKSELNDIILNRSGSSTGSKKIVLAVATLGVILIIVVMIMNTLASGGTDNLPQAVLPPEPQKQAKSVADEPLFEDVNVVQESDQNDNSLDQITQKLKEESIKETSSATTKEPVKQAAQESVEKPVKQVAKDSKKPTVSEAAKEAPVTTSVKPSNGYYIQVGSFTKNQPDKKILDSILALGYKYKFHEMVVNSKTINKVLVGPFQSEPEARKALASVRSSVEANAFLTKI